MTAPIPDSLESLCRRTEWLRRLARQLVADAHVADDVAQAATLAALEKGGSARDPRAWLAGVTRRIAADWRRNAQRRARIEARAPRNEDAQSTLDAVVLVEQQRLLAEAVLALPPVFRDVVVLRYYEGLPPRAIAAQLRLPIATVRSRSTRALAKLRAHLDEKHGGDRHVWVGALAPLALARRTGRAAPLAWVGAAALVLGVGIATARPWRESSTSITPALPIAEGAVEDAPQAPPAADAPAAAIDARDPRTAVADAGPMLRVVDGVTGEPVPTAELFRFDDRERGAIGGGHFAVWMESQWIVDRAWWSEHGHRIALDDAAACPWPETVGHALLYARDPRSIGMLRIEADRSTSADNEIRLWPLHTARVFVVDAAGKRLPGVTVSLRNDTAELAQARTRTADGAAELCWFRGMDTGDRLRPMVGLAGPAPALWHALEEDGATLQEVQLLVPPAGGVEVQMTIRGAPAPEGTVVILSHSEHLGSDAKLVARTTSRGVATFWPVALHRTLFARAQIDPRATDCTVAAEGPKHDGDVVVVHLDTWQEMVELCGRVIEADGTPLRDRELRFALRQPNGEASASSLVTDASGGFSLIGAVDRRRSDSVLEVRTLDVPMRNARAPITSTGIASRIDLGDVVLDALPTVLARGVVVDEAGLPMRDVVGSVRSADQERRTPLGLPGHSVAPSDDQGRFVVYGPGGASLSLQLETRDHGRQEEVPLASGQTELRVVMHDKGSIVGRVRAGADVPIERLQVDCWPVSAGEGYANFPKRKISRVDRDGAFALRCLATDVYHVAVVLGDRRDDSELVRQPDIAVDAHHPERTPPLDFDITELTRMIDLHVTDGSGTPLQAQVEAHGEHFYAELGTTDGPLVVPTAQSDADVWVRLEGYFSVNLGHVEGRRDVVLERGLPVAVEAETSGEPPAHHALRVCLREVSAPRRTRSGWRNPDCGIADIHGITELRARTAGEYIVQVFLEHNEGGYSDEVEITPEPVPRVRVTDAEPGRVRFAIDADALARALAKLAK